ALGQSLPGPQEERYACPTPVVDEDLERDERFGSRLPDNAVLIAIRDHRLSELEAGAILSTNDVLADGVALYRSERLQHFELFVANDIVVERVGRLHGHEREQLEQMV